MKYNDTNKRSHLNTSLRKDCSTTTHEYGLLRSQAGNVHRSPDEMTRRLTFTNYDQVNQKTYQHKGVRVEQGNPLLTRSLMLRESLSSLNNSQYSATAALNQKHGELMQNSTLSQVCMRFQ